MFWVFSETARLRVGSLGVGVAAAGLPERQLSLARAKHRRHGAEDYVISHIRSERRRIRGRLFTRTRFADPGAQGRACCWKGTSMWRLHSRMRAMHLTRPRHKGAFGPAMAMAMVARPPCRLAGSRSASPICMVCMWVGDNDSDRQAGGLWQL